jgi:hypothetical protein
MRESMEWRTAQVAVYRQSISGQENSTMTRRYWTMVLSCAAILAPAVGSLPTGVALAANSGYDGTYHGDVSLTRGDEATCGKSSYQVTYTVVNGQFSMVYDPAHHVGVNLVVEADGSFSATQIYQATSGHSTTQLKASGRIAGNVLEADIEGHSCTRHYHLTKTS